MAKTETKLEWMDVQPEALSPDAQAAYGEYKAAYRLAKEVKERFEAIARLNLPNPGPGREIKFGYNFGKLSIAVGEAKARPADKPKLDLAAFITGGQG